MLQKKEKRKEHYYLERQILRRENDFKEKLRRR